LYDTRPAGRPDNGDNEDNGDGDATAALSGTRTARVAATTVAATYRMRLFNRGDGVG
jgi:hypothetical protein